MAAAATMFYIQLAMQRDANENPHARGELSDA